MAQFKPNRFNPKKLLLSKWTAFSPENFEKHFMVIKLNWDEHNEQVLSCDLQAVLTKKTYTLVPDKLRDSQNWQQGWL